MGRIGGILLGIWLVLTGLMMVIQHSNSSNCNGYFSYRCRCFIAFWQVSILL